MCISSGASDEMNKQLNCYSCLLSTEHRTYDFCIATIYKIVVCALGKYKLYIPHLCVHKMHSFGGNTTSCLPTQVRREFEHLLLTNRCSSYLDGNRKLFDLSPPAGLPVKVSPFPDPIRGIYIVSTHSGRSIVHANYRLLKWVCLTFTRTHIWFTFISISTHLYSNLYVPPI